MKLLSVSSDAKTSKGESSGFLTGILYLSPANESGIPGVNLCPFSTPGCRAACLYTAGRASMFPAINAARQRKTAWLTSDRVGFCAALEKDIAALVRKAERLNFKPCVRINGTSDLPWLAWAMCEKFPNVQFYDYTKIPQPWKRTRSNYHLTFSLSETNEAEALAALASGTNVAVVFNLKKGSAFPETWNGYKVISGDENDLRFLNDDTRGTVIGLYAKGRAKKDVSGFVQDASKIQKNFVPIAALEAA